MSTFFGVGIRRCLYGWVWVVYVSRIFYAMYKDELTMNEAAQLLFFCVYFCIHVHVDVMYYD
ncbi:hypothetical protein DFH27DRAFT_567269 [Peziza echinospora]|nr:hypothetical protein DFH27DRAFT_567269 [Peziza echinospora]